MSVRKAVIPAAGLGTRFLPATKAQPKEMLPLVDKPIIQYVVEEAVASGIEDILIITGRGKRAIEDHFDRAVELERALEQGNKDELLASLRDIAHLAQIHFIRQKEPRGLGHAVYQARCHVGDEPFAVLLGDEVFFGAEPCLAQLLGEHARLGGTVVAVREVPPEEVHRYGIVRPAGAVGPLPAGGTGGERAAGAAFRVADLVEKPARQDAPSNLAVVGRYIIDPTVFKILESLPPGAGGEIQLTDALRLLAARGPVHAMTVAGRRYDVGDKLGFLEATVDLALDRPDLGSAFAGYLIERVERLGASHPGPSHAPVEVRPAGAPGADLSGVSGLALSLGPGGRLSPGPDVSVQSVSARSLAEVRPLLHSPAAPGPAELYRMYRGVGMAEHGDWMRERGFRYDVTVIAPGRIGAEYIKTAGHHHPAQPDRALTFGEVYEVLAGRAMFLFQKGGADPVGRVEDVILVEAGAGEKVAVPSGYAHITINIGPDPLVLANWVDPSFQSLYEPIRALGGAAYFILDAGGRPVPVPNPRYTHVSPPRRLPPAATWVPLAMPARPIYRACLDDPALFEAILRPRETPRLKV